jgi:hypothetical protein
LAVTKSPVVKAFSPTGPDPQALDHRPQRVDAVRLDTPRRERQADPPGNRLH